MLNLIGVIVAFAVIIILIRKKLNFGLSLILGSLVIGVFSLQEIKPVEIPKAMIEASFYSFKTKQIVTETVEKITNLNETVTTLKLELNEVKAALDSVSSDTGSNFILFPIPKDKKDR